MKSLTIVAVLAFAFIANATETTPAVHAAEQKVEAAKAEGHANVEAKKEEVKEAKKTAKKKVKAAKEELKKEEAAAPATH